MIKLTEESLDFAKQHIEKYYDSDFFPKPFEFEAIWHNWDEVIKGSESFDFPPPLLSNSRPLTI